MINNAPAPDVYTRPEANEIFDTKADKTDIYTKTEIDILLDDKADKIDICTKTETDTLLDAKADKTDLIDSYTKTETDSKLDEKADKTDLIDSYTMTETDTLLDAKADKIDTYIKTETDTLLDDKADKTDIYTKTETDTLLDAKADKTDIFTKTETDTLLDDKADKIDIIDAYSKAEDDALLLLKTDKTELIDAYTKTETDSKLDLKVNVADIVDSYSKTETDTLLDDKADKTDTYTKTEADTLLDVKADKTDLANYVDLTSAQTISGQKQFGIINVSSISKQSKNDASILLTGGGDMLVSSLVTQPQLQEVRDIATGKSKAYVFSTQDELNDWMAIQDNVAKLVIGDNLYIVDKEVTDYWKDGTDLKVLETELPDMSNVITTLGAATGSGNAITDISIYGNALTPAKNTTFVTTGFDQSIIGMKTFTSTIISNGIQYLGYHNSSVFLAGGGVRSIADIQSASYTKSEDDALLLLKADKTELIDSYTKTETNNLLNSKTDNGVSYTKSEYDALLLLKADMTELIDSYTKTETNNLLNSKTDNGVSYTKSEDDALLLLKSDKIELIDSYSKSETYARDEVYTKTEDDALLLLIADKTQLIDSYTKTETNNLLNNMTDTGVSYTKGEDDTLLFAKADKTQLIDSYTKTETNNLLNDKANQSTTYTKTETDQLISQIDTGSVDLSSYYTKTKTDELLDEKANSTDLSNYMTLGTSQTITANKTFNNACILVSSIDGMSTVTGSSFVKSGADDTVVLLGAGGTKPLSEFASGTVDDSNYLKKTGQELQIIHGVLRREDEELSMSEDEEDYLTRGEIYNAFVSRYDSQTIYGTKTFNANVNAAGFAKTGKDDTSVLLAGSGDQLLSSFGGVQVEDITNLVVNLHSNITFNYLKLTRIGTFYTLMMEIQQKTQIGTSTQTTICTVGSISNIITPPTPPSTIYPISLATKRKTLTCMYSYRDFRISTDSTEAWGVNDDVGLQFSWKL
ncbi:MAG: hypothetical protein EZS28_022730 [Streblomastix strix]|uniref:Uncharacterized protein n=1 Tax=Streblomastix strix TaxID=222440 RepID=A0A5J4VGS1_9EUKA|nr:MAG: hypothetical protein EZS28_022730 [Streblomastix strix]